LIAHCTTDGDGKNWRLNKLGGTTLTIVTLVAKIIVVIAIIAAIIYVSYWLFTKHMETFEILFGNGWLYIAFLVLGIVFSAINIPLYKTRELNRIYVNLGGCILPLMLSSYLLLKIWLLLNQTMIVVAISATIIISRIVSWYVKGKGVLIVGIVVEFTSTLIAHFLPFSVGYLNSDPLPLKLAFGYLIATIGVLVGGDLLHLGMMGRDGRWHDKLSIGGAGTKDGVWSIGLGAMLLILLSHSFFGW